jgi:hypothetical protein
LIEKLQEEISEQWNVIKLESVCGQQQFRWMAYQTGAANLMLRGWSVNQPV